MLCSIFATDHLWSTGVQYLEFHCCLINLLITDLEAVSKQIQRDLNSLPLQPYFKIIPSKCSSFKYWKLCLYNSSTFLISTCNLHFLIWLNKSKGWFFLLCLILALPLTTYFTAGIVFESTCTLLLQIDLHSDFGPGDCAIYGISQWTLLVVLKISNRKICSKY